MEKKTLGKIEDRKGASSEKCREYSKILSEMINCKTVFTTEGGNKAEYEKFYSVIENNFPNIAAKAKKLVLAIQKGRIYFAL